MKKASLSFWIVIVGLSLGISAIPAQGADSKAMTIRVTSIPTTLEVVKDREPSRVLSAGDVIRARSTLRNAARQFGRPTGAVVGRDVGLVTFMSSTEGAVKVTATLPGGTIRSTGRDTPVPNQTLRVVGGTEVRRGAWGPRGAGTRSARSSCPQRVSASASLITSSALVTCASRAHRGSPPPGEAAGMRETAQRGAIRGGRERSSFRQDAGR